MPKGRGSQVARKARSDLRAARFQARQSRFLLKPVDIASDRNSVSTIITDPCDQVSCVQKSKPVLAPKPKPDEKVQVDEDDVLIITEDFSDFD